MAELERPSTSQTRATTQEAQIVAKSGFSTIFKSLLSSIYWQEDGSLQNGADIALAVERFLDCSVKESDNTVPKSVRIFPKHVLENRPEEIIELNGLHLTALVTVNDASNDTSSITSDVTTNSVESAKKPCQLSTGIIETNGKNVGVLSVEINADLIASSEDSNNASLPRMYCDLAKILSARTNLFEHGILSRELSAALGISDFTWLRFRPVRNFRVCKKVEAQFQTLVSNDISVFCLKVQNSRVQTNGVFLECM